MLNSVRLAVRNEVDESKSLLLSALGTEGDY
jgi:hypothetical protein